MAQVKVTKAAKRRALQFRSLVESCTVKGRYEDYVVQVETAPGATVDYVVVMRSLDSKVIVAGEPKRKVAGDTEKAAIMVAAHDAVARYVEERG